MNHLATSLLAATEGATRTRYELARVQSFSDWWQMPLLAAVCLAVAAFVIYMYRRDSVELKPGVGVFLALLRLAVFAGLVLVYLDIERRTETKVVRNSRVLFLVDTSLSMGRTDAERATSGTPVLARRIDEITAALAHSPLIESLRKTHDVEVVKFDSDVRRVAEFGRKRPAAETGGDRAAGESEATETPEPAPDWQTELEPQGSETRLAAAVRRMIEDERNLPVSGIVVFSDGGQNAGVEIASAVAAAKEAKIPVHTIAIGSDQRPVNVRVSDLVAPARAYPGDKFQVTGYVQSQGLEGRQATVELTMHDTDGGQPSLEITERVTLAGDSDVVPVRFDIPALEESGRRVLRLRVKPLPEDREPADNQREVDVDVVDRKNRVLLFAGGPSREYQFLRNMLRRAELAQSGNMIVDVLLQSASEGISQDANEILDEFPRTMQELAEYDTIVAFDPDWQSLDLEQIDLLERWVGEESGGLVVVAGPVHTDSWVQDPEMSKVRALYPVEFNRRLALLEDSRYGSPQAWPIEFSREGLEAEFLWLDDNAAVSQEIWDTFEGVYGYYRVRGPKLGATNYALFSDPDAIIGDQKPVYFAGHFYGSGRVFYMGSGEIWRLRSLDERYFDIFYTKLIRHVSQGRLLRGSRLGTLLVERDRYVVGNTIVVRAQLSSAQLEPLDVPSVTLRVTANNGLPMNVELTADPARKGMYAGQFTATQEGEYRIELEHPESSEAPLSRRLQVFMPKLEQENPARNDKPLKELADGSGGQMYVGVPAAIGPQSMRPLAAQLRDMTQETYVTGRKDREWERSWMHWMLGLICGALSIEWLTRRLFRLA